MTFYVTEYLSPVGKLLLASDGEALCGLWLDGQRHYAAGLNGAVLQQDALPIFEETKRWLESYFAGKRPDPQSLPLSPCGSAFRMRVWMRLCAIPYGESVTYGELAKELATSPRAIGGAVGRNPISLIIPCHRVVGSDGSLTGYAGGTDQKKWLLEHEKTR